jgi:hypothetical protein
MQEGRCVTPVTLMWYDPAPILVRPVENLRKKPGRANSTFVELHFSLT